MEDKNQYCDEMCKCGLNMVVRQVVKDGPNKGKTFFVCPKKAEDNCKTFKWAKKDDEIPIEIPIKKRKLSPSPTKSARVCEGESPEYLREMTLTLLYREMTSAKKQVEELVGAIQNDRKESHAVVQSIIAVTAELNKVLTELNVLRLKN